MSISAGGTIIGGMIGQRGLKGDKGDKGDTGSTGNGIASISKIDSVGLVDTYRVTYTNGNIFDYEITNGNDGEVQDVKVNGTSVLSGHIANIDLTDYVKNTDYASDTIGGVLKVDNANNGVFLDASLHKIMPNVIDYATYSNKGSYYFISKGTLENVLTAKGYEVASNKVTTLSNTSTDTQYPSAKCVYDLVGNIESILEELDIGEGV